MLGACVDCENLDYNANGLFCQCGQEIFDDEGERECSYFRCNLDDDTKKFMEDVENGFH